MTTTQQIQHVPVDENGNEMLLSPEMAALAPAQQAKATKFRELLMSRVQSIAAVATRHLTAEKLVKIMGTAASRTPKLLDCTPQSILLSVMTLSELGLMPGTLGTAYLIPFNNKKKRPDGTWYSEMECQLIIGYRGLITLARRSGEISTVMAEVVREGDVFEFEYGLDMKFRHVPKLDNAKARVTHVWAMATFRDGGKQFIVMTRGEVDAVREMSKAKDSGPWVDHPIEMAKKTAIRRLAKMLPLTPEVERQIEIADKTEFTFEQLSDGSEIADAPKPPDGKGIAAAIEAARAAKGIEGPKPGAAEVGSPAPSAAPKTTKSGKRLAKTDAERAAEDAKAMGTEPSKPLLSDEDAASLTYQKPE